jgi:hypothetical protein
VGTKRLLFEAEPAGCARSAFEQSRGIFAIL